MVPALWDDVGVSGLELDAAFVHVNGEFAGQNEKELVGLGVAVANEVALHLGDAYVVVVDHRNCAGRPVLEQSVEHRIDVPVESHSTIFA